MDMNMFLMLTLAFAVLATSLASSSRFIQPPQSQSIIENDAVDFGCEATGPSGDLHYEWLHNGQQIVYDRRVAQIGSNLHIESLQREDAGDYVCIAASVTSGARQASPPAKLSVIYLDSASVQLLGSNRNELLLKCHVEGASGDEPLHIEWYRDSAKLSTWQNVELQQHRLLVRQPSDADDGLYRCIASNAAARVMSKQGYVYRHQSSALGVAKCLPRLKKNQKLPESWGKQIFLCRGKRGGSGGMDQAMSLPPSPEGLRIVQGPNAKLIIKEGDSAALSCLYELPAELQNQRVQLRWRKDGKILRHVELGETLIPGLALDYGKDTLLREDGRLVLHKQNGTMSFNSIIASDAGQYMCQIQLEGHAAVNSSPGTLEVIEQLKFMPQPTSKNLELGSLGKLHCKAQGTPTPQVQWLRDATNGSLPEHVDDINGTLIFRNVSAEHRGNYTCLASNSQGQINATVSINVVVAPRFSVAPVGPIETAEQGVAVIHCQAIGDPKPTIQWDKDLQYLSENNTDRQRFSFLENGTLAIRNVQAEDEGKYGCTIGNSAGLKREEVRLLVRSSGDGFITEESAGDGFLVTRAVLITMTVALAYIVLVVGLMLWCRYRRQARKARLNELSIKEAGGDQAEAGKSNEQEPCLSKQQRNGHSKSRAANGDAQKSDDTACSQQSKASKKSAHIYEQLALPRSGLTELIQIGRGEFGDVFVGKLKASLVAAASPSDKDADTEKQHSNSENGSGSGSGSTTLSTLNEKRRSKTSMDDIEEIKEEEQQEQEPAESAADQLVLVKALNKVKDEQACQEFRRQLDLLRAISHKGVVRLFGLCREKDPHYMVLEYTDWGDLKQFLLATAGKVNTATATSSPPPLTTSQMLAVAYQIARGMDAIYRARFTHRDLATRNCVISSEFIVKVAYPALCKDKYSREYHKHRNTLLPVRWLAPECIQEDEYTTKSDIFAFGVVVWELFNQATKLPHEDLTNEQVVQRALANTLEWSVAEGTPDCLKEILLSCWLANPKERPSFSQLGAALSKAMQSAEK
ncbi:tyrosine-protein kinase-like otk [Drosophila novamexicana]|uniref:tyrosine-protein kinase-like otk n=1 Tax=Drosophila novamexicana TaxID=47314 RepID=UPI0011E58DF3|nr:tyrosine-protein kinase-like otk [Drosophila novamexicana]